MRQRKVSRKVNRQRFRRRNRRVRRKSRLRTGSRSKALVLSGGRRNRRTRRTRIRNISRNQRNSRKRTRKLSRKNSKIVRNNYMSGGYNHALWLKHRQALKERPKKKNPLTIAIKATGKIVITGLLGGIAAGIAAPAVVFHSLDNITRKLKGEDTLTLSDRLSPLITGTSASEQALIRRQRKQAEEASKLKKAWESKQQQLKKQTYQARRYHYRNFGRPLPGGIRFKRAY